MKKIIFSLIIILLINSYSTNGQTTLNSSEVSAYENIPQESVFIHQNTSFLLSGEYLYYKVYCLNDKSNNLSDISKIAYVELVGSDKIPVFKHKIKLNKGLGQGDFLIPTSIISGNYKLIAYTQWMRNLEQNQFFQSDISIINPFHAKQSAILKKNQSIEAQNIDLKKGNLENNKASIKLTGKDYIELNVNSKLFKNREKVVISVKSLQNNLSNGNYSLSVRKIDSIQIPLRHTTGTYKSLYPQKSSSISKTDSKFYLPELRGELLSGKVFSKDSELTSSNIKIAISIPGKQPIFKIATTNDLGIFYFNIHNEYEYSNAIIQVIHSDRNNFNIMLNEHSSINYGNLNFYDFRITSNIKDYLLKRSIYNQIENVYSSIKPNTFKGIDTVGSIFNSKAKIYFLDDYTRFSTIKETIVEVINEIYIKQKKENSTFHVRLYDQLFESNLFPLILVDGILIQNHNELLDLNVNNIQKISVVSDKFIYDALTFEGVISIETFNRNYQTDLSGDYIKKLLLFRPLEIKDYFNQIYDDSKKSVRIPDYRSQLLWQPNFILNKKETTISFFTSDNRGKYEICLEGFTNEGKPVSLREIINVK